MPQPSVHVRLSAVILAVTEDQPRLLTVRSCAHPREGLPFGTMHSHDDRTLELAVRRLVSEQTGLDLRYVEQLYTFGDRGRDPDQRVISVAYLALVRESSPSNDTSLKWINCYSLFPWEDWRKTKPRCLGESIEPVIQAWVAGIATQRERADIAFGLSGSPWDSARVLERYELLYEVNLVEEFFSDRGEAAKSNLGYSMALDHRRMVATALGRIRGKISYRPVVFELLPTTFTLSHLQKVAEALAGMRLHTSNFRRLVERGGLVERTGTFETRTGGRPAELFCFRRDVLRERPAPGVGLPGAR